MRRGVRRACAGGVAGLGFGPVVLAAVPRGARLGRRLRRVRARRAWRPRASRAAGLARRAWRAARLRRRAACRRRRRRAGGWPPLCFSSAATRSDSASISARSPRTSSSTRRSSKLSRIRWAAEATSSSRLRPRSRAPSVPPVVAWKVRSTAPRTASTTSAGSRPLSFFAAFLSFLAMVAAVYVSVTASRDHPPAPARGRSPSACCCPATRAARCGSPSSCSTAPKMLNHNRGLWGYTGAAADGAPLTIQSTGHGRAERGDRDRGADRARRAADRPRRDLRRAGRRARARRRCSSPTACWRRTARAGRSARAATLAPDPALHAALRGGRGRAPRPRRLLGPLLRPRPRARAGVGRAPARSRSRWRPRRCSAVAARRGVAAACVLAVSDLVADRRADRRARRSRPPRRELGRDAGARRRSA